MRGSPCPALWLCVARSCDTHTDSFSGLSVPAPPRTSSSTTAAGVHTPHSRQHPDSTPWRRQLSWQVSTMPSSDCSHSSALPPCRWPAATTLCPLPSAYLLRLQLHLELAAPCPGRPRSAAAAASWGSLPPCIEPTIFTFMFNRYSQTKFTAWDPPCCIATGPTLACTVRSMSTGGCSTTN